MEFREQIEMDTLRVIRDNFEVVYDRMGKKMKIQGADGKYTVVEDYKQAFSVIEAYYNSKTVSQFVRYRYSGGLGYGRRFHCSPSLQELARPLRHTIARSIYYDIDIKNAHPTFLLQYCRNKGFNHPVLEQYVEGDREKFLHDLVKEGKVESREEAKCLFLQVLNGGGHRESEVLKEFYARHQTFLDEFFFAEENLKYKKRAVSSAKDKSWDNAKGSALNYYLCEMEDTVLKKMEAFAKEQQIEVGVLCFDGMMVYRKTVSDPKEMVKQMSAYVSQEMGFPLLITVKEMDEALDVSDLKPKENQEEVILRDMVVKIREKGQLTHKEAAELFYKHYKDDFYYTDAGWVSWMEGVGWRLGDEQIVVYPVMKYFGDILTSYVKGLEQQFKEGIENVEEEEDEEEEQDTTLLAHLSEKARNVVEKDLAKKKKQREKEREKANKAKEKANKEKEKEKEKTLAMFWKTVNTLESYSYAHQVVKSMNVLFYNNKILAELDALHPELFAFSDFKAYNLNTGEIVKVERHHKIRTTTGYPMPKEDETQKKVVIGFLRSILLPKNYEEEMEEENKEREVNALLSALAQGCYGGNINQLLIVLQGAGSNAKSLLLNRMAAVLGDYYTTLPPEQITHSSSGKDSHNTTLANCRGKRMVVVPEVEGKDLTIQPSAVKPLTGEKKIKVRDLHSKPVEMIITFTLYLMSNNPPKFARMDYAVERRLTTQQFPNTFFRESLPSFVNYDPKDPRHFIADESKENQMIENEPGLLWVLLRYYTSSKGKMTTTESNQKANNAYILESSPLADWIQRYEPSSKFVRAKVLYEDYSSNPNNNKLTPKEFNKFLRAFKDSVGFNFEEDSTNGNKVFLQRKQPHFSKPEPEPEPEPEQEPSDYED